MRFVRPALAVLAMLAAGAIHMFFSWTHRDSNLTILFAMIPIISVVAVSLMWPRLFAPALLLGVIYAFEFVLLLLRGRPAYPSIVERVFDGKVHLLLIPAVVLLLGLVTVAAYRKVCPNWADKIKTISRQFALGFAALAVLTAGFCAYLWRTPVTHSIHDAARLGYLRDVRIFVSRGVDVNARDQWGYTPLHSAASSSESDIVGFLLANGADVHMRTDMDESPLHWAANSETASLLLDAGAEVNAVDGNGRTPLNRAARNGHKALCELLITRGANVNAVKNGWTSLHYIAIFGRVDRFEFQDYEGVIELLIRNGADPNATDLDGMTPLDRALWSENEETARLLRKHRAKAK